MFIAGIVLAVMVLPIITAMSREVFAQTPAANKEGALALGATRWEMIRTAVLPFGRAGVISAAMLGLGRALGETIAITIIVSPPRPGAGFFASWLQGGETFASKIANNAAEFKQPRVHGRLHRRRSRAVRPDLRGQRPGPHRHQPSEGLRMSAVQTPERELPAALADSRGQGGRKVRNSIATVVVVLAFVIAVIPLVWILWTVIDKGASLLVDSTWWLNSQRGITPRIVGGGAYHAIVGTLLQALATGSSRSRSAS